jgi:hypothetical protein
MGARKTSRRPDGPALTVITGEAELRLRAWLAKSPGWSTWKEHGVWHAGFGGLDLVDDYDFAVFVQKLEDLGTGRPWPSVDHLAVPGPAGYNEPPDDTA